MMKKLLPILFGLLALAACDEDKSLVGEGSLQHPYAVDLGLSVKWASCNVGASLPEEYGDYFAWGEISTKSYYSNQTYQHSGGLFGNTKALGDISETEYDVARAYWGEKWRMPTLDNIEELYDKCDWVWTTKNDVTGVEITGPNGRSIFLPAAGRRTADQVDFDKLSCYYWSSTPLENDESTSNSYSIKYNTGKDTDLLEWKVNGLPIRPVTD